MAGSASCPAPSEGRLVLWECEEAAGPLAASRQPLSAPFSLQREESRVGAAMSCWHGSGLPQAGLGGVPVLGGPPGLAARVGTRGGRFNQDTCQPESPEAGGLPPCKTRRLHPVSWPSARVGPAGCFHRVIKCQRPIGRQQQLPGLPIRVAKEAAVPKVGRQGGRTCPPARVWAWCVSVSP